MSGIMAELAKWDGFYGIVGPAAGALIGLQFVVLTLIAQRPPMRVAEAGAAFVTPTIVHFASVLLLSALLRAPWETVGIAAALWSLVGVAGIVYSVIVARRMRTQAAYRPELEDWWFHIVLPVAAYAVLAISPFQMGSYPHEALFAVGAAALLLLFAGIHNAWDGIAYHVFVRMKDAGTEGLPGESFDKKP
jgi:cytochrome c-type biogenesis protein CcmH/NrfG